MSKCKRCGANVIRSVALADGVLCYKCFDELGFDKSSRKHYSTAAYDEIKDGYSVYIRNLIEQRSGSNKEIAQKLGFSFAHYGEEREVNETDEEAQIFDVIRSMVSDPDGQHALNGSCSLLSKQKHKSIISRILRRFITSPICWLTQSLKSKI